MCATHCHLSRSAHTAVSLSFSLVRQVEQLKAKLASEAQRARDAEADTETATRATEVGTRQDVRVASRSDLSSLHPAERNVT